MRRTIQTLMALSITFGAFATLGTSASANVAEDYQDDMYEFVPVLRNWIAEIEQIAERAVAKPSDACSEEVVELSDRGAGMARDLVGTIPPAALEDAHSELINAFFSIANTAANGCAVGAGLGNEITDELEAATDALRRIGYFASRAPGIAIELPVPPVTGN